MMVINKSTAAAILIIIFLAAGFHACRKTPSLHYDLQVIKVEQGWGYEIRKNNKPFIFQDCIPAITGKTAFADRKSARKTGRLVLKKLRNDLMPAVSIPELEQLGVIGE